MGISASDNVIFVDFDKALYFELLDSGIKPSVYFTRDYNSFKKSSLKDLDSEMIFEFYKYRRCKFPAVAREDINFKDINRNKIIDEVFDEVMKNGFYFRFFIRDIGERVSYLKRWGWVNVNNEVYKSINFYLDLIQNLKINKLIMSKIPHEGSYVVLYVLCRKLGLETLVCSQSLFPNYFWLIRNPNLNHFFDRGNMLCASAAPICEIPEVKSPFYMKNVITVNSVLKKRIALSFKLLVRTLTLGWIFNSEKYFKNMHKLIINLESLPLTRQKKLADTFNKSLKYVYFPLHLQPEMTTDTLGGIYADQLYAIEKLRAILPSEIHIYCKENPKQKKFMRDDCFYERLRTIPNLSIMDIDTSTFELISGSLFVATITGTAGWEALRMKKKVMVFGDVWYKQMYGVYNYNESLKFENISLDFNKVEFENSFSSIIKCLHKGVIDEHYNSIVKNWNEVENAKNVVQSLKSIVLNEKQNLVSNISLEANI